jgi:hypothetical protein
LGVKVEKKKTLPMERSPDPAETGPQFFGIRQMIDRIIGRDGGPKRPKGFEGGHVP